MSKKREKYSNEKEEKRLQALKEAHLKEGNEYKQRMKPLLKFLKAKKLKFSHAAVGSSRVEYFRLDEYNKILQESREQVEKDEKLSEIIKKPQDEFIFFKRPEHIKIKYPKILEPLLADNPDRKYASFRFDTTQSNHFWTIFIIFAILLLVLFPIWPYELKYGISLVSFVILIILVGVIVVRLVVYLLLVIFNYHVWIFPNFLGSTGFLDSFLPVIEVTKGDKSWFNVFIRLFAISSFILFVLHAYLNPTFIDDNIALTKEIITDVHDWGVSKLKNEGNFSQRAITNLEHILNQTADAHEYEDYEGHLIDDRATQPEYEESQQFHQEQPQHEGLQDSPSEEDEEQL